MTNQEDMIRSYLAGASYDEIAKFYGISKQRVHQIVKRAGAKRDNLNSTRRAHAFEYFDERIESILLFRGQRATWPEVYEYLKVEMWTPDREIPSINWFDTWRKEKQVSVRGGTGPLLFCSKLQNCVHPDGPLQPRENFHHDKHGPDGLASYCKSCCLDYQRNHMEEFVRRNREYRNKK
jgi:hypothetical protein